MRQRTLLEADPLTELSRLGWGSCGIEDGLYIFARNGVVRSIEDPGAWLAAGAPEQDPVDEAAVCATLARGPATRAELRRALAEYDLAPLAAVLRSLLAGGEILLIEGRYGYPEVEL